MYYRIRLINRLKLENEVWPLVESGSDCIHVSHSRCRVSQIQPFVRTNAR